MILTWCPSSRLRPLQAQWWWSSHVWRESHTQRAQILRSLLVFGEAFSQTWHFNTWNNQHLSSSHVFLWRCVCVFQLTSCGVYQRGKEDEGVFGFLVDDIKQEIRRSARLVRTFYIYHQNRRTTSENPSNPVRNRPLGPEGDSKCFCFFSACCVFQRCCCCKKKGACVGCNVRSCKKMIHFPCGRKQKFISQFTELFPWVLLTTHSTLQSSSLQSEVDLRQSTAELLRLSHILQNEVLYFCSNDPNLWLLQLSFYLS